MLAKRHDGHYNYDAHGFLGMFKLNYYDVMVLIFRNGGLQMEDFECLSVLGRGHFGKVHHGSLLC